MWGKGAGRPRLAQSETLNWRLPAAVYALGALAANKPRALCTRTRELRQSNPAYPGSHEARDKANKHMPQHPNQRFAAPTAVLL